METNLQAQFILISLQVAFKNYANDIEKLHKAQFADEKSFQSF